MRMLVNEDPSTMKGRLVKLVERINLPHKANQEVASDQTAGLYMLKALPDHISGIVMERLGKTVNVTQEHTLNDVADIAQDVFVKLKQLETKILKSNLEQENLVQYVGACGDGATKTTSKNAICTCWYRPWQTQSSGIDSFYDGGEGFLTPSDDSAIPLAIDTYLEHLGQVSNDEHNHSFHV
ncbi:hypothetical protein CYMTET_52536 [Cymbomonas tetramitiformis]|uniref:Uncharacterized protein n=1 Tax=Cymbomonas tetramitiformis TaxID=36881 RepID=A0AAE0ER88_9CHLO|nr:hypothetical protein CYMTET_52536 [Cymbomonas tetramitiformis]